MAQRRDGNDSHDRESADFRRLAAQLGISTRVLLDDDRRVTPHQESAGPAPRGDNDEELRSSAQQPRQRVHHNGEEAKEDEEDTAALERVHSGDDEEDDDELEESLDQYQYDSIEIPDSLVLASDSNSLSASESISSELSLPRSFGQYDAIQPTGSTVTARRKPFSGISQFDDHLMHFPAGAAQQQQLPAGRRQVGDTRGGSSLEGDTAGAALARIQDVQGSDMMKKFYEVQVEKIRSQLVLTTQAQRQVEKTLQDERKSWQDRLATIEKKLESERSRLEQENAAVKVEMLGMKKRLKLEKTHFANLQISEALAEQLSRQDEQDLSIKEFIQLAVHRKVSKLEIDLEAARKELEELQKMCVTYKSSASSASDEVSQIRRVAEVKELRLQHELELATATRLEMEHQIAALCTQIDAMKEEQRQNDAFLSSRTALQGEIDALRAVIADKESAYNLLRLHHDDLEKKYGELRQKVALLSADKSFLQDAKAHLEEHEALLLKKQQDLVARIDALQSKHEDDVSQSLQFQNETRLHFEKKLDDEVGKFMEISKQEIERIRNSGQIVYERENRLLKEARDDALKQVELLQAKLDQVQSALEEKVLETTRMESNHTTSLASLRNDLKMKHFEVYQLDEWTSLFMDLLVQLQVHKEEFAKLESTSTTKITQLEAGLEIERNKLKEYEQLEIDLDDAVVQTGAIFHSEDSPGSNDENSPSRLNEVMTTFGAIPTSNKRRFQQSVSLAQRVVKYQRESLEFQQKLKEANCECAKLENELKQMRVQLVDFHQPQIDKLSRKEQELQAAQKSSSQLQKQLLELRNEYALTLDAKMSLQKQLQQVLARREDLDLLKSSVQVLRQKLHAKSIRPQSQSSPLAFHTSSLTTQNHGQQVQDLAMKLQVGENDKRTMDVPSPVSSFMKVSPPASIASKMTEAPHSTSQQFASADRDFQSHSVQGSTLSLSKWYTKLRS